ncbi:YaiO family outer membrane beta-barrel protein [Polaribacter litorisediminis]|uniref:YaiO family outer membrane beta-barrel protein n=1 Tax=Polaribacter litorisediminis TaxID=1908341 RepID=UPI001CC06846|nr:YaiO family outer membrane beta-barrel protein [Polaribacter litorisediminis]UAM99628.1 YaiO family outer membrane beta-barrel protein [Polaribacter litorisediminis]
MGFDEILRIVLNKDKERKTDWIAYVKNEQYAEKYFKSLELVQKALLVFPGDADLLQLKAKAELNSNNSQEALITMKQAVKLHPDNEEVLNYKNSLESDLSFNTLSIDYSLEVYQNKDRDHMHYTTVQYARQTKYGSINAKINYTNRFLTDNYQLEIDLYPRIVKGLYAYVSGGWSQSPLNPSARYGAELFKSLPKSFEASLGFRWLKFSTETTIYTGSLGWYTGNSYWALRSYVTPGFPGTSASGRLFIESIEVMPKTI